MPDTHLAIGYRTLGRTGLRVSEMGLGGGGQSCLGLKKGKRESDSVRVVQRALESGINLIDTSARNGTEAVIGRAIRGFERSDLVLSTKCVVSRGSDMCSPDDFARGIEDALSALNTDYIDIMHFHGVKPEEYDYVVEVLLPVMERYRDSGKIRFIGVTEIFDRDRGHAMLERALQDDFWDVMMVGFNLINQSARERVFASARDKNVGILGMFAVRRALTSPETFHATLTELRARGELKSELDDTDILDRITRDGEHDKRLVDIAYRYCRDEPGMHSVLVGTGDIGHLEENIATFCGAPLPAHNRRFVDDTFSHIHDFSGN